MPDVLQPANDMADLKLRFDAETKLSIELDEKTKACKAELLLLESELLEEMKKIGEESYRMNGRTYHHRKELTVRAGTGYKMVHICKMLEMEGFGHIVSNDPSYKPATLKATVKELLDDGQQVPDLMKDALYIKEAVRLRSRKS